MLAKKIDEEKYEFIKNLLKLPLPNNKIAEMIGVSKCTLYRIKGSENYEDYLSIIKENHIKTKSAKKQNIEVAAEETAETEQTEKTEIEKRNEAVRETYYLGSAEVLNELRNINRNLIILINNFKFLEMEMKRKGVAEE